jgi:hypothetical protein
MKIPIIVLSTLLALLLLSTCYYDSQEYLYPELTKCDSAYYANITYTQSVVPILQNNCLSCHSNSTAHDWGADIKLEDYPDVKLRVDDHRLLNSITWSSNYKMPYKAPKLDSCSITTISVWIDAGAPNN